MSQQWEGKGVSTVSVTCVGVGEGEEGSHGRTSRGVRMGEAGGMRSEGAVMGILGTGQWKLP